jgi:hypothetical protein
MSEPLTEAELARMMKLGDKWYLAPSHDDECHMGHSECAIKRLVSEVRRLQSLSAVRGEILDGFAERIFKQSELLSKREERKCDE